MKKAKRVAQKAWKVEKSHPPLLNENQAQTNYLLHVEIVNVIIKKENQIKNYLDLFIYTRLNDMSIRSRLVSQPKIKLILNSEQLFNATDLPPITFGVILPPNLQGKISTNSQNNTVTLDEKQNSKVCVLC